MNIETLLELLEALGYFYDAAFEGSWMVFRNDETLTEIHIDESDLNKFKFVRLCS